MIRLIAAEVLKLRTTRTMWALLAATVAVSALAVASSVVVGADVSAFDLETARGARGVLSVATNGTIFVLVLGIILSAGEYRMGTATDTFLTTPRRWKVIGAKLIVGAVVGFAFGALSSGVSIAVADAAYRIEGYAFPFESSDAWPTLAGVAVYGALFGAIGAATGSLVRNQVVGIVGWLVWLAVVEHLMMGLLPDIGRWLPAAAGQALARTPGDDLLAQPTAAFVLALYAVAIGSLAVIGERYRDA